ncbi:DHHA1 domain-containing protein, partial [Helicobacter sp. UBA3407]
KQYRGFLSYSIGNISVLANLFLKNNPHFDFFIDVSARGNVSLRANNACDVSVLAKNYFNGGGHANASGGKIDGFKESFIYDNIKECVQNILKGEEYE